MKVKCTARKILSAMLALCLLAGALPRAGAMGGSMPRPGPFTSGQCGPDAFYEVKDGVMTISGTGPVTNISADPRIPLTTVIIEDGITSLCSVMLAFIPDISRVEIPASVTHIGSIAFSGTAWLEGQTDEFVIVGDGVLLTYKGPGGEVTIPDTVRSIAGSAFFQSDITAVTIGSSVEEIGDRAFSGCAKLEKVTVADTVSRIEGGIFDETPWLRTQEGFVILGDHILAAYNGSDKTVVVPDTVRSIAPDALSIFEGEYLGLEEITIPETVTELGDHAIHGTWMGLEPGTPVTVHGALGSAVQDYIEERTDMIFRFVPFGQEEGSLFNFFPRQKYVDYHFRDASSGFWFGGAVETVYVRGLMRGTSDGDRENGESARFSPDGNISVAEAITVAARVRDTYYYEQNEFIQGEPWYGVYVDYALEHGILAERPEDYERPATRAEFAALLAAALPAREFQAIHEGVSFADVTGSHPNCEAIMLLSRAGVMQGKGEGFFDPDAPVLRCEAAVMLSRCVCPDQRIQPE